MNIKFTQHCALVAVIMAFPLFLISIRTSANTFNVTQTTDGTASSQLRGAILAADALGGGPHTINVPAGTFNLTLGAITFGNVALDISIVGQGASSTIINMTTTGQDRIFFINPPGTVANVKTTISGIKFTNGHLTSDAFGGGAIICGGPDNVMNIANCTFENNEAPFYGGGALAMSGGGSLTVDQCTFTNNKAHADASTSSTMGGAIAVAYYGSTIPVTGSVSITNCTFTGNSVTASFATSGGAISVNASSSATSTSYYTKIEKNTFTNNSAGPCTNGGEGGAISLGSSFAVDLHYNTFSGNTVDGSTKDALVSRTFSEGAVDATNNWWGCNTDPQSTGCSERARLLGTVGTGTLTTTPQLVLKVTAERSSVCAASPLPTTITASFLNNSANTGITLSNLDRLIGMPVSFSAANGSMTSVQTSIQSNGKATAVYNSGGAGAGSVNALAGYLTSSGTDNRVSIETIAAPTFGSHPAPVATCLGAVSVSFSVTANSTASLTYQWYRNNSILNASSKFTGVKSATLTINSPDLTDNASQYKVLVSNGCSEVPSNSATLTVQGTTLYVASSGSGDGSDWDHALGSLSAALLAAKNCSGINEIWVKSGTYKPSAYPYDLNVSDARQYAFFLIDNVSIYGGFAGTETILSQRNPGLNQTILSGDLGGGTDVDNALHVVVSVGNTATARLDGFIIQGGNSNVAEQSSTINGSVVTATSGGGIVMYRSSAVISNCVITVNAAMQGGGIYLYDENTTPLISNCVVTNNSATTYGGGIFNGYNTEPTIVNCTIAGNAASSGGGGIVNYLISKPHIINSVIWINSGTDPTGINDFIATPVVTYSIVQGGYVGTGNLGSDPAFANVSNPIGPDNKWMTADDGLRLSPCSPARNKGLNTASNAAVDLARQTRLFDLTIDMGAYEWQAYADGTSLSLDGDVVTSAVPTGTTSGFVATGCRVVAQVTPSGDSPVTGNVQAKVYVAGSVIDVAGAHFVQRHFDIVPATNPGSATATVKLFFTQAEFDAFNLAVSGGKLPTSPSDGTGKSNLLIVQYHGTSATGQPGSYTGDSETITPGNDNIVWNTALSRWEVSFEVNGFSGFFVSTETALPLKLLSFSAKATEGVTRLQWETTEELNTKHFEIQRSGNTKNWFALPNFKQAAGHGSHQYEAIDTAPFTGTNYYRLKMVDLDETFTYSRIISVQFNDSEAMQLKVYPNPASTDVNLEISGAASGSGQVVIYDKAGNKVVSTHLSRSNEILKTGDLPKGIYLLRVRFGGQMASSKLVIE